MASRALVLLVLSLTVLVTDASTASRSGSSAMLSAKTSTAVNPIRKVVTMLQMMQKKVEEEGVKEEELYEKFMCWCKNGAAILGKSISDAETKIPQLESKIEEQTSSKTQMEEDVKNHQSDRAAAKDAMAQATAQREKEAAAFAKEHAESNADLDALAKALAAIEKGMAG